MILDTSAMVAILYREPEAADFTRMIRSAVPISKLSGDRDRLKSLSGLG